MSFQNELHVFTFTMVYGKVIQNIKEKIVLYSTVFCPNTGEYGAKRLVLTVNSQSFLYQNFYLIHVLFITKPVSWASISLTKCWNLDWHFLNIFLNFCLFISWNLLIRFNTTINVIFLVRKTDKNFKLERKLKFTQFCNF